jgi:hypothetical protein
MSRTSGINFANFATDSELSSGLATKQDTLIAATNLLGVGSAITALDYTKITLNKPSVFPPDVANIYIKSEDEITVSFVCNT